MANNTTVEYLLNEVKNSEEGSERGYAAYLLFIEWAQRFCEQNLDFSEEKELRRITSELKSFLKEHGEVLFEMEQRLNIRKNLERLEECQKDGTQSRFREISAARTELFHFTHGIRLLFPGNKKAEKFLKTLEKAGKEIDSLLDNFYLVKAIMDCRFGELKEIEENHPSADCIAAYVNDALDEETAMHVRIHLLHCNSCFEEVILLEKSK